MSLRQKFFSLLNQASTNVRAKYISQFKNNKINNNKIFEELELEKELVLEKKNKLPKISYPNLPVTDKVEDIKKLILENQIIVVAGETGSGKSTQLPKICLDLGLGVRGLIGHTQPRRIATRSIATRVANEINSKEKVSYKIRFTDQTSPETLVKVMTDGVLLSEIKNDKYLSKYEVIIIDEAHERSLNIDFLMGCIKKILPFRPDLKIIITSATIDQDKFCKYFNNAKQILVSGRTYPVEIKYQDDDEFLDFSLQERILYAIEELDKGDILIFLPTERDIHETLAYLNKQNLRFTEVLPLFSRLSIKEQDQIFNPQTSYRRIILATNVAETSVTVPRIKYVIDSGLARVSRYSYRTKVQRLPVEKISQASANQRAGRCGRLSAGVCIRLFSEDDYNKRKEFTEPEILRTNLASVILQMQFLQLGNIQDFPFLDKPDDRFIKDGYRLLFELKAIDKLSFTNANITDDGKKMALLPLDPKLSRMLITANQLSCLEQIAIIVSFLSIQDPRERPLNAQEKSDQKHNVDNDKNSDFLTILNFATRVSKDIKDLTNRQKRDYFKKNYISIVRFNEWRDIYRQIKEVTNNFKWKTSINNELSYENIHKSLASGLLSNIGYNFENAEYLGARGNKFFIFPGSSQFKKKPKWLLTSEIVETTKTYARLVAKIESEWLESLANHLVKKNYDEPFWSQKRKNVLVNERISLYGLEIIKQRQVLFAKIDLQQAREIFIKNALVIAEFSTQAYFFNQNKKLIKEIEDLENKSRRKDILIEDEYIYNFYNNFIPKNVYSGITFEKWLKTCSKEQQKKFLFTKNDLMQHSANTITEEKFPTSIIIGNITLPIKYSFDPTSKDDGVTLVVPSTLVNELDEKILEWGIYGFLEDKISQMLRALPKNIRKHCVPVPTYTKKIIADIDYKNDRIKPFRDILAHKITRIVGFPVQSDIWQDNLNLDPYLTFNIKIVSDSGKVLIISKDIQEIKNHIESLNIKPVIKIEEKEIFYNWNFTQKILQEFIKKSHGIQVKLYNCLEEKDDGFIISEKASYNEAVESTKNVLINLYAKKLQQNKLKQIPKKVTLKSLHQTLLLENKKDNIINRVISEVFLNNEIPTTKEEFEAKYISSKQNFNNYYNDFSKLVQDIEVEKKKLEKSLLVKKIPLNLISLFNDISSELNKLFFDGFISVIPFKFINRYIFYIKALSNRLEKAKTSLIQDRKYTLEIENLRKKLFLFKESKHLSRQQTLEIEFLIFELWISYYLQTTKTIEKVSEKRILKKMQEL